MGGIRGFRVSGSWEGSEGFGFRVLGGFRGVWGPILVRQEESKYPQPFGPKPCSIPVRSYR